MSEEQFPQAPPMSDDDSEALMLWGDIDFKLIADEAMGTSTIKTIRVPDSSAAYGFKSQMVEKDDDELERDRMAMARFMAMGAQRNIQRHAEAWGPVLIAMMVQAGVLSPLGDPGEILRELIDDVLFLRPQFEKKIAKKPAKKKAKSK